MRKGISTSMIRANIEKIETLPVSSHYELTFFKQQDVETVLNFLKKRNATFGIHAPFIYKYKETHPFPTHLLEDLRIDTYITNVFCGKFAKNIGAEYIVIHFPNAKQKDNWKKEKIVNQAINHIVNLNRIIETRIENVYLNDYFHNPQDYVWLAKETNTRLCIDIGHLLIDTEYYMLDPIDFLNQTIEYTKEYHLYYADIETYNKCHHAPWGDSLQFKKILELIAQVKKLDIDLVIEPSNDCPNELSKLLEYWEAV